MVQLETDFINFLKHVVLPKRAWQGHDTSVGRVDLLVYIIGIYFITTICAVCHDVIIMSLCISHLN